MFCCYVSGMHFSASCVCECSSDRSTITLIIMARGRSKRFISKRKRTCSKLESHDDDHDHVKKEVISKLLLPEDVMFDILSLVPLKWLFHSARYVCKPWATITSTSHFAEAHLQLARAKPGLYVENYISKSSSYFLDINGDVNGQFERIDLGTPPRMGYLIRSCDGILLLCNGHEGSFVVNPFLKCWLRIPPLPNSLKLIRFIARYQFTIVRVPRTAKFKLFFVEASAKVYVFYVLKIGIDNSWKEIARKEAPLKWSFLWDPVYNGGNDLYWLTRDGVIVMDVDKEIFVGKYPFPLTPMPVDHPPMGTFLWIGNHLSCIVPDKPTHTTYKIYTLDIDSGKWTLYHEMGPFDFVAACGRKLKIACVVFCFWTNDQIIIRAAPLPSPKGWEKIHFCYNVKTRELTKIEGIAEGEFEVWPHINSLVSLPSTPT